MAIKLVVNPTLKALELQQNGKTILTLSQEDTKTFLIETEKIKDEYRDIFFPFKYQITLAELKKLEKEHKQWGKISSIDFYGEKMLRLGYTNFYAKFVFENEKYLVTETDVKKNFKDGYLWEGNVLNFDLKNCLSEDLRNYFMNDPDLSITFAEMNVTAEVLYNKTENEFYFDESYDT